VLCELRVTKAFMVLFSRVKKGEKVRFEVLLLAVIIHNLTDKDLGAISGLLYV